MVELEVDQFNLSDDKSQKTGCTKCAHGVVWMLEGGLLVEVFITLNQCADRSHGCHNNALQL